MSCKLTEHTINDIYTDFDEVSMLYLLWLMGETENVLSPTKAKEKLLKLMDKYKEFTPIKNVILTIEAAAESCGLLGNPEVFFTSHELIEMRMNPKTILHFENNSTELIEKETKKEDIKSSRESFLYDAYGFATEVSTLMQLEVSVNFVNSLIIDRSINGTHKVISNDIDLNNKIKQYLELLLLQVIEFIKLEDKNADIQLTMYDEDGDYNAAILILNTGFPLAISKLRPSGLATYTMLLDLYKKSDTYSKAKLNAYNAYFILNHFDELLKLKYGDTIEIKEFGDFSELNKYRFAQKGKENKTTWRTSEEIVLDKEINRIVQELINTTPRYQYNGQIIEGLYLSFNDFSNIISLIKDINDSEGDYLFTRESLIDDSKDDSNIYGLSQETLNLILGKSLKSIISLIRLNPQKYLSVLFEILSNNNLYNLIESKNSALFKKFKNVHKQIIYSLYKGIFSLHDTESLYAINLSNLDMNYYGYIAQAADSIFSIRFAQYYRDMNGELTARDMTFSEIRKQINLVLFGINSKNSPDIPNRFEDLTSNYNVDLKLNFTINFKINGAILSLPLKGSLQITRDSTVSEDDFKLALFEFISDILGIHVNDDYLTLMSDKESNVKSTLENLLKFAASVLQNTTIANIHANELTTRPKVKDFIKNHGLTTKYNINTNTIGLNNDEFYSLIEAIAYTEAAILGLITSTLVKNGEGNSLSSNSLSRLLGSYKSQWETIKQDKNSAVKEFSLINNPNLLLGLYTMKEYNDLLTTADHTSFTASEFYTGQLLIDFVGGFCEQGSRSEITRSTGNQCKVSFIPSVNSDKNTIGRMVIDINQTVEVDGQLIQFSKLTEKQWWKVISKELGSAYLKTLDNINTDLERLSLWINRNGFIVKLSYDFSDLNHKYGSKAYNQLNEWVKLYNKENPLNIIQLIDQVHIIKSKQGTVESNLTLLNYIDRFTNPEKLKLFWKNRQQEVLKNLVYQGFTLNLLNDSKENNYIKSTYPGWINKNNYDLILATYIDENGVTLYICNENDYDIYATKCEEGIINKNTMILNPFINLYNYMDYFFTQEWMNSTVGSLIAHPAKLKKTTLSNDTCMLIKEACIYIDDIIHDIEGSVNQNELLEEVINKYNLNKLSEYQINTIINELDINKLIPFITDAVYTDNDLIHEEASRFMALHKRNVSFTATMQEFTLGLLNGIPSLYNIAVTSDVKDSLPTINGTLADDIKPYDGATFVNPFITYLENYSLGGAKAGITKKLFVHFYNKRTGTGGIIKTCGFGLTNNWMRTSPMMQMKMWKMTHMNWRLEGTNLPLFIDITKDYNDNQIKFKETPIIKKEGKFYRIDNIIFKRNNRYDIMATEIKVDNGKTLLDKAIIDSNGESLNINKLFEKDLQFSLGDSIQTIKGLDVSDDGVLINSNYALWTVLGGKDSYSYDEKKQNLIASESSIINTVEFINKVGKKKEGITIVKTADDVYLPLKHSDIHYEATAGAVKLGAANINSNNTYFDNSELNYMQVDMLLAGIQLDKEHHATDTELSLMTLVISACIHLGYTADDAENLYKGLAELTDISTKLILNPFKEFFKDVSSLQLALSFKDSIINTVLKLLSSLQIKESDLLSILAKDLIAKIKSGLKLTSEELDSLPINNPAIYAKFISTLSSFLTKSGIKAKIPGILSVLTPSHGIIKLYAGMKWEAIENNQDGLAPIDYLLKILDEQPEIVKQKYSEEEIQNQVNQRFLELEELLYKIKDYKTLQQFADKLGIIKDIYGDLNSYVASLITPKSLRREDSENSKGFDSELGWGTADYSKINYFIAKKGEGYTPDELAYSIWENAPENIQEFYTTLDIKNSILDIISNALSTLDITGYSLMPQIIAYIRNEKLDLYSNLEQEFTSDTINLIKLGRSYNAIDKHGYEITKTITSVNDLNIFRKNVLNGLYKSVKENIIKGRDLATYDCTFKGNDNLIHSVWEFDSVQALSEIEQGVNKYTLRDSEFNGVKIVYSDISKAIENEGDKFIINLNACQNLDINKNVLDIVQYLLLVEYVKKYTPKTYTDISSKGYKPLTAASKLILDDTLLKGIFNLDVLKHLPIAEQVAARLYILSVTGINPFNNELVDKYDSIQLYNTIQSGNLILSEGNNAYAIRISKLVLDLLENGPSNEYLKYKYHNILQENTLNIKRSLLILQRKDLAMCSKNGSKFYDTSIRQVSINGKYVNFDLSTVHEDAYELVLPKRNVREFMLEENDDLNTIIKDKLFFANRLKQNLISKIDDSKFEIELKNPTGEHYYLSSTIPEGFHKLEILTWQDGDKFYRINTDNDIIYELSSNKDKVYIDDKGNEVIVTDNLLHYVNKLSYAFPRISSTLNEVRFEELIRDTLLHTITDKITKAKVLKGNKKIINYLNSLYCTIDGYNLNGIELAYRLNLLYKTIEKAPDSILNYIEKHGIEMHTSFIKTLDVVASRTPSQSMQSFMPMKIIAFDNPNVNTAFVNTMLILLQGSKIIIFP